MSRISQTIERKADALLHRRDVGLAEAVGDDTVLCELDIARRQDA